MIVDPSALRNFLQDLMPRALDMLREMVSINSFTANRDGVNQLGRVTAGHFGKLGFIPEFVPSVDPALGDHLAMNRPGTGDQTVAMISHLDTVFPPEEEKANDFHWQIEEDYAFGPGTLDIKGGTVMMWMVLTAMKALAPAIFEQINWKLFWNSSEERLSPDFAGVCRSRLGPNTVAILVFEAENRAGDSSLMVAARKGRFTWRVIVKGRGAHAGGNLKQGANAIVQLGRILQQVDALTDFSKDLTFNVGQIAGGTVLNRVPHEAMAEGEFRAFSPAVCEEAKSKLLALAGPGDVRSALDGYPCEVFVEVTSESRPWPLNPGTERLLKLWTETAKELRLSVLPEQRGGLSDGNGLWDTAPTLDGLGPWGDNDHCSERSPDGSKLPEFVQISSFVPKAVLNTTALLKLLT